MLRVKREGNFVRIDLPKLECEGSYVVVMRSATAMQFASVITEAVAGKHDVEGIKFHIVRSFNRPPVVSMRIEGWPGMLELDDRSRARFVRELKSAATTF